MDVAVNNNTEVVANDAIVYDQHFGIMPNNSHEILNCSDVMNQRENSRKISYNHQQNIYSTEADAVPNCHSGNLEFAFSDIKKTFSSSSLVTEQCYSENVGDNSSMLMSSNSTDQQMSNSHSLSEGGIKISQSQMNIDIPQCPMDIKTSQSQMEIAHNTSDGLNDLLSNNKTKLDSNLEFNNSAVEYSIPNSTIKDNKEKQQLPNVENILPIRDSKQGSESDESDCSDVDFEDYVPSVKRGKDSNYPCTVCDEEFQSKTILKRHIATMHNSELNMNKIVARKRKRKQTKSSQSFLCTECDIHFTSKYFLNKHLKSDHGAVERKKSKFTEGDAFPCTQCPYSAKQKWKLARHIKEVHLGSKIMLHRCEFCTFSSKRHHR